MSVKGFNTIFTERLNTYVLNELLMPKNSPPYAKKELLAIF